MSKSKARSKNPVSPELGGGGGTNYECRVAAIYLVSLLIQVPPIGYPTGKIDQVRMQRKGKDALLDDLKIMVKLPNQNITSFDIQIKRALTISDAKSNEDFREIVKEAWRTINSSEFNPDSDHTAAIAHDLAASPYRDFRHICEIARNSHDESEFFKNVDATGQVSFEKRKHIGVIKKIIAEELGYPPSDRLIWIFFKHFSVIRIDAHGRGAEERDHTIQLLDLFLQTLNETEITAENLFKFLCTIAHEINEVGGSIDRNWLVDKVRDGLGSGFTKDSIPVANSLDSVRSAAEHDLGRYSKHKIGSMLPIELEYIAKSEQKPDPQLTDQQDEAASTKIPSLLTLSDLVENESNVILQSIPGAGKTTTLIQIAERVIQRSIDGIPILISLATVAEKKLSIKKAICDRGSFAHLEENDIHIAAKAGSLILLCDGWNEISINSLEFVYLSLEEFCSDYPSARIVVATRPIGSRIPIPNAFTISINRLTSNKQLELAEIYLDKGAKSFLANLKKSLYLREILTTPFYLGLICRTKWNGGLPETPEQVIHHSIVELEQIPAHFRSLKIIFENEHPKYLTELARTLTSNFSTSMDSNATKHLVNNVSRQLVADGLLSKAPSTQDAIETLHNHHTLICLHAGERYQFQHQLIQEWYSSKFVEKLLNDFQSGVSVRNKYRRLIAILNHSVWQEALTFVIDRTSTEGGDEKCISNLIRLTLGIDPLFAAFLISRANDSVWSYLKTDVRSFLQSWRKEDSFDLHMNFIIMTGRSDFSEEVWNYIETNDPTNIAFHRMFRLGIISANILGSNPEERIRKLDKERRESLLYDLASDGSAVSIQLVAKVLESEPDIELFLKILGMLDFRGADEEIRHLLGQAEEAVWKRIPHIREFHILQEDPFRTRYYESAEKEINETDIPTRKISLMEQLNYHLDSEKVVTMVQAIIDVQYSELPWQSEITIPLISSHTSLVTPRVVQEFVENDRLSEFTKYIDVDYEADQPTLLLALKKARQHEHRLGLIPQLLDKESVSSLLSEYLSLSKSIRETKPSPNDIRYQYTHLRRLLESVRPEHLVDAVIDLDLSDHADILEISWIIAHFGESGNRRSKLYLPEETITKFNAQLKSWVRSALEAGKSDLHLNSRLACLLGSIGTSDLVPMLSELTRYEIAAYTKADRIVEENHKTGKITPAEIQQTAMYPRIDYYCDAMLGFDFEIIESLIDECLQDSYASPCAAAAYQKYVNSQSGNHERTSIGISPNYQEIKKRREFLRNRTVETNIDPKVKMMFDQLNILTNADQFRGHYRIAELARIIVQFDNFGDPEPILRVAEKNKSTALCRQLIYKGYDINNELLEKCLFHATASATKDQWRVRENWHLVKDVLALIAFSGDPMLVAKHCEMHHEKYSWQYDTREIIVALGHSEHPDALKALQSLARTNSKTIETPEFIVALSRFESEFAAEFALDLIFDDESFKLISQDRFHSRTNYQNLISTYPRVNAKLIDLLKQPQSAAQRAYFSYSPFNAEGFDQELFLTIFESTDPTEEKAALHNLGESLERVIYERVVNPDHQNSWSNQPIDATSFRQALYDISISGGAHAKYAADYLRKIYLLRYEYGKSLTESKHPDSRLRTAFPPEAEQVWKQFD